MVTADEDLVLRGDWTVTSLERYVGWEVVRTLKVREKLVLNTYCLVGWSVTRRIDKTTDDRQCWHTTNVETCLYERSACDEATPCRLSWCDVCYFAPNFDTQIRSRRRADGVLYTVDLRLFYFRTQHGRRSANTKHNMKWNWNEITVILREHRRQCFIAVLFHVCDQV